MPETSLLPRQSSGLWEAMHSRVEAARWPLPADLIRTVNDPWTCPVDLLPWLARGLGLEIWHDDWPEAFKRRVIAELWALKRNKTKLKGIRQYAGLEGARLVSAHRPRDKFWWAGGQSQADRDATIALMPWLRIALRSGPATAGPAKAFWSGPHLRQCWHPRRFWIPSDAAAREAARVTYVDGALARPVTVRGLDGPLDASLRVELQAGASLAKLFWGARQAWGTRAAFVPSDAEDHLVAITPGAGAAAFAVPRGLRPATVRPVRVAETVPARAGMRFWGARNRAGLAWARIGLGGVWLASDAEGHVYDRVTLHDPSRPTPGRQPYSFWGWSRFAAPAFTAEIRLDVRLTRPPHQFGWGRPWGGGAWQRADRAPLWRALRAVKLSQAYRDTVWVDLRLTEPITFAPGLRFGEPPFTRFGAHRKLP